MCVYRDRASHCRSSNELSIGTTSQFNEYCIILQGVLVTHSSDRRNVRDTQPHPLPLFHYTFVIFRIIPKGFFIQSLQPSHAEFIATHHPYYKLHYRLAQLHFKYCLSNPSVGVFTDTMPPNLVCWIVRSYDGSLHHLYTLEQYRRRGLATAVVRMMCKHIQDQGDVPFCCILTNNHTSSTLFTTLGFTESQEQFLLIKTNQEIISQ